MILGIFGKPRSGKTTYATYIVQKNFRKQRICRKFPFLTFLLKPYTCIYCTDHTIQGTIPISYDFLGMWKPIPHSLILLEEAGIGLNNRNWKRLSSDATDLFCTCGHKKVDIIWSSQTADVDCKLLSRTHRLLIAKPTFIPHVSFFEPISFSIGVDNTTHTLQDMYTQSEKFFRVFDFITHRSFLFYRKPWYRYFDSYVDNHTYTLDHPC